MSERSTLDRREFTVRSLVALLSGVAITITGCGEGPTQPTMTDKAGAITANHGHSVVITAAQLGAGGSLTLDMQGTSTHRHTVELAAGEVLAIRDGRQVVKTASTSGSHGHTVTFN
jgi:hypothetical protein